MAGPSDAEHDAIDRALAVLGLSGRPTWDEIRAAYRTLVRASHPDVARTDAATARTAAINEAFAALQRRTDDGRALLPERPPPPSPPAAQPAVVLRSRPGDVYVNLLEAAHELGDVCYLDPEAGLIQILLTDQGAAGAHLLIDVDRDQHPPRVAFTLESADASVPPIADVVGELATHLRGSPTWRSAERAPKAVARFRTRLASKLSG